MVTQSLGQPCSDSVIVYDEINGGSDQLPVGWTDEQDGEAITG